jgi:DNA-binding SARP family transcriptional activator
VDPQHPDAPAGMERVRKVLQERNKQVYIEAVLAESYSDFETARRKYQQLLEAAPADDIYYQRAKRKLAGYLSKGEEGAR